MKQLITVAIVEDNTKLRHSLELLLSESPGFRCAGLYGTAEAALEQLPKHPAEVVLMDINLPNLSGIECTRRLKELMPSVLVVMITAYGDNDSIFNALRAGASGYLLKRSHPDAILEAITEVRQGGSPMSSEIARKVVETFKPLARQSPPASVLSRREQEALELIAKGFSDKEIADQLGISVPTVRFHLQHIYEKLHVHSRTSAALKFQAERKAPGSLM